MNKKKSLDGNTAAAHIAYAFSEVSAIYPITPSTTMAELVDQWITEGKKNIFDEVPTVVEMQSEAGAAGAVHGILSAGALATTFTASQGLLLMIPNMYKIAGELLPTVFHVSARAIASQALSIFGDHQDVMAVRQTGFALLCSSSVQEAQDLALVAHLSTLKACIPFVHFFDGFRTSHEIQKIDLIDYESIKPLVDQNAIQKHRDHALNPMHPYLKGTAQNPDIYFQENEALNPFYFKTPDIVEEEMDKVFQLTKRRYHLFDYIGDSQAERIIVIMGSGAEAVEETVNYLNQKNEKVGLIKVRLYRPFSKNHFLKVLPKTVKKIAVLDRTKENGSFAEPLFLDVSSVLKEEKLSIEIVSGRYGLGSKDFTPSQIKAVFDNLKKKESKSHFTVGIVDDVTFLSLPIDEIIDTEDKGTVRCKFWGIGGDGTVGANKDAIKIIGDNTDKYVQGFFVYDSKKTSGITISHLRFGDKPIHSTYLIQIADYIACHHPSYVLKYDLLEGIKEKGIFVLNAPWETLEELENHLPNSLKKQIAEKKLQFYVVNAAKLAKEIGLGNRINMIMQTVFFKLSEIIPIEKAISLLKDAVQKTYGKKGEKIVQMNNQAIDSALKNLLKIPYPASWVKLKEESKQQEEKPDFIKKIADVMNAQKGDTLPVSVFAPGGEFPLETTKYEKRSFATQLAKWKPENCIQCNQCAFVCPHAAIRPFLAKDEELTKAPNDYVALNPLGGKSFQGYKFSIQVSPYDCTGCMNCVNTCPAKQKALEMVPREAIENNEMRWWDFAIKLPQHIPDISKFNVKGSQFQKPLLEFSGACAGCGETPYVKSLTQLFGERMVISNATGCSSIWGGSAPSIPWAKTSKGYGPAWANSLFEDNAEYGFGMYLATATRRGVLAHYVEKALKSEITSELKALFEEWLVKKNMGEQTLILAEKIIAELKKQKSDSLIQQIQSMQDLFVKPCIWIIGGDGWAYDIGYGGLDHVLAMNQDVKVLVLDTEVYSNTGGQASKSTPIGAVAKFASNGKKTLKKDLGRIAMTYENIYVASIAMGYDMPGVIRAFKEAEEFPGPALIIAYASCIAHGIRGGLSNAQLEEKLAVESGYWINYRYDPRLKEQGKNPFQLDSKEPTLPVKTFIESEERYNILLRSNPEEAQKLVKEFEKYVSERYAYYKKLSENPLNPILPLEG
jgi:pyruvate-ferredoxin/flavodoxin oxidoreductase